MRYGGDRVIMYTNTMTGTVSLLGDVVTATIAKGGALYEYCSQNGIGIRKFTVCFSGEMEIVWGTMEIAKTWESALHSGSGECVSVEDTDVVDPRTIIKTIVSLSEMPEQKPQFSIESECQSPGLLGYGSLL